MPDQVVVVAVDCFFGQEAHGPRFISVKDGGVGRLQQFVFERRSVPGKRPEYFRLEGPV
jgi:hypothetical protein